MAYAAGHALNGYATHGVRSEHAHINESSTAAGGPNRPTLCGTVANMCTPLRATDEITCPRCRSKMGLGRNRFNRFGEAR